MINSLRRVNSLHAALTVASVLSLALLVVRACMAWRLTHFNLVWNLFLAWVPLGFAGLAARHSNNPARLVTFGFLWLLFFPNAPYLVTDLVHLRERPPVPFWFDIVVLQSFIGLGLLLTFISLYRMQSLVSDLLGSCASWLFVSVVIALTGFGIYLGRVQRWNSWDAVLNPIDLARDVFGMLFAPRRRSAGTFTLIYAGFLFVGYLLLYSLTHLNPRPTNSETNTPL